MKRYIRTTITERLDEVEIRVTKDFVKKHDLVNKFWKRYDKSDDVVDGICTYLKKIKFDEDCIYSDEFQDWLYELVFLNSRN